MREQFAFSRSCQIKSDSHLFSAPTAAEGLGEGGEGGPLLGIDGAEGEAGLQHGAVGIDDFEVNVGSFLVVKDIVKNGHGHAADKETGDFTGHQCDGQALENGIGQNHCGTDDDRHGGE